MGLQGRDWGVGAGDSLKNKNLTVTKKRSSRRSLLYGSSMPRPLVSGATVARKKRDRRKITQQAQPREDSRFHESIAQNALSNKQQLHPRKGGDHSITPWRESGANTTSLTGKARERPGKRGPESVHVVGVQILWAWGCLANRDTTFHQPTISPPPPLEK